jgi:hypothetical protein
MSSSHLRNICTGRRRCPFVIGIRTSWRDISPLLSVDLYMMLQLTPQWTANENLWPPIHCHRFRFAEMYFVLFEHCSQR